MLRDEGRTSSLGLIGGSASDPQTAALSGSNYKAPALPGDSYSYPRASFVVSHCVTPVCVTTPLHSTMRAAANPMQQVYRNITKTIQFGHVPL